MSKTAFLVAVSVGILVIALAACTGEQPTCPVAPATADWGPIADMNGQSSVDIELDRIYIIERVRSMLEGTQSGDSGAFVRTIDLKDIPDPNNRLMSVLVIRLEPWLRDQSGQPASLQRSYRLSLKITPHIVNEISTPDQLLRKKLLCLSSDPNCTADQGALLTFDLQELYNVSAARAACDSPDLIDKQIVPEIYKNLAAQQPLRLPTESISAVLALAAGGKSNLRDVNVSASGFLNIGLQYDLGGTHDFDRNTMLLSHFPNRDWLVNIDTSILSAAVGSRMQSALSTQVPGGTITSFNTTFSPGVIRADGFAAVPVPWICGSSATVTITAINPMQVCKDGKGSSVIATWADVANTTNNACVNFKTFWDNINVGTVSGPPAVWPTLAVVSFPAGDNDTFYATDLDLDNGFAIIGRSTMMDRIAVTNNHPRAEAPAKCPGVP